MTQICRLCLKTSQKHKYEYISVNQTDNNGVAIATLVKALVPELYLGLSLHPVICQPCYDALRDAYSFRLQCLRSENLIGIYMRETRCTSVTIVLQDVIDYWRDVYKNKQCQTAVAQANLEEWFGLDTSHIRPDNMRNYSKRKTESSKDDEQVSLLKSTDERKAVEEQVQSQAESIKNTEQASQVGSIESGILSSDDIIGLLHGNYRIEVENVESDVEEENSSSRIKQEAIEKTVKDHVSENEPKIDETPNTPPDSNQDAFLRNFQEICGCPPAIDCPSSNFTQSLARKRKGTHDDCVILCEYRHLEHCKYFRTANEVVPKKAKRAALKTCVEKDEQALPISPTSSKTYTKKANSTENEVMEKPTEDSGVSASLFIDDVDEDNLFEELQKCYKAGKFGFSQDFSNLKENFVLKKFFDKTDNSYSYALLPKTTENDLESSPKTPPVENLESLTFLSDAYLVFKSKDLTDRVIKESVQMSNSVGQNEEDEPKITPNDDYSLEPNNELVGPSQAQLMPMIRVRPVSTLQKVRTLNHELFPLSVEAGRPREAAPRAVMQPVRQVPIIRSTSPPVVLNSTVGSSLNNVLLPIDLPSPPPPNECLKTVTKTYSKPLKVAQTNHLSAEVKGSEKVVEKHKVQDMQLVHHVKAGKITKVALTASEPSEAIREKNNAEQANEEDTIDIKEEPLDYAEDDLSNEKVGEDFSNGTEWSGETTRSSSETSLMEKFISQDISQLIGNIPDVGQEFDEPEYVHINKVSFADITKLVKESKQMKEELKQKIESNRFVKPLQLSSTSRVPRRNSRLSRAGKRVRIVPVATDANELPLRKTQRTLVKTVERTVSDRTSNNKDVCVLFTNFTSEGDYINDHDYLVNPYMRNNMSIVRKSGMLTCACLLCNIIHPHTEHIAHMKCHGTKCAICQVDFHNVFILNLHARAHVSYCRFCHVTVTYSRYLHHAVHHNRLLAKAVSINGKGNEGGSISTSHIAKGGSANSPRRSRRLRRAKNYYEGTELDEEEACIYDKATKSFLTPSVVKQEKLSKERGNDTDKKSEGTKSLEVDNGKTVMEFVNLADLKADTRNINVNFAKKSVPQNVAPKKTNFLYGHGRRKRYAKRKKAENVSETPQHANATETSSKETETEKIEPEETETKRTKFDSENECDDTKDNLPLASITRRLSLRRRCPRFVPKSSSNPVPSLRQRRTKNIKAKSLRQKLNLSTKDCLPLKSTASSDLAAAVDAIISSTVKGNIKSLKTNSLDGKAKQESLESAEKETVLSKCLESSEDTKDELKPPSSKVAADRSSRSRRNVTLVAGLEVHRLARSRKARKQTSPAVTASASSNQKEIEENLKQPEPPASECPTTQSPSIVTNTTASLNGDPCNEKSEKDSLERACPDQCEGNNFVVPSVDGETN